MKTALLRQLADHADVAAKALYALVMENHVEREAPVLTELNDCDARYAEALVHAVDAIAIVQIALDDLLVQRKLLVTQLIKDRWSTGTQPADGSDDTTQEDL